MSEVIVNFEYNNNNMTIQSKRNENLEKIFQRYIVKINKNIEDIFFLHNGKRLSKELRLDEIDKINNEIKILVFDTKITENNTNTIIQSKDIICPICKGNCIFNMNNFKITLRDCDNKHKLEDLFLKEYIDSQKIDEKEILCYKCKVSKSDSYHKQFYKCCNCNIFLCPLHKSKHDENHIIIDFESKNYICNLHGERFTSYCKECNKNLCDLCEYEHDNNHHFIYHKEIKQNDEDIKNNLNELKMKIITFKTQINNLIIQLNEILDNIQLYYNISANFILNYNIKKKNYQNLMNRIYINNYNKDVINKINLIINEKIFQKKIEYIKEILEQMKYKNIIKNIIQEEKEYKKLEGKPKEIEKQEDENPT